jgi:MFS transporter, ACS family, hexuronate transporter
MTSHESTTGAPPEPRSRWRWVIIGLILLATVINYFDRLALPTLAPALRVEFGLTSLTYAWVANAFLITYALSMFVWGAVFDRVGNRAGFALAVVIWSVAECATGAARNVASLCGLRGVLGAGESGNWPGATRAIAEWFPAGERALAMGIANTGAALGPMLAVPAILSLRDAFGWRAVFLVTGSAGFVWLAAWLVLYPRRLAPQPTPHAPGPLRPAPVRWRTLLRRREAWGIIGARFLGDPIWWLYVNWMPLYLVDAHGYDLQQVKATAWVPYAAAAIGALSGGWCSGFLIRRHHSVNTARKFAILVGTTAMLAGFATASAPSPFAAVCWMSVTLFGFQFWVGNVQTLASDYFPLGAVGSIAGFAGTAAGLGAVLFTFSTGWIVDRVSYAPILVAAALLAPMATAVLFTLAGPVRRLELP